MATPVVGKQENFTEWYSNKTNLCYEFKVGTETVEKFCGKRDDCSGLLLPLVFEENWSKEFRVIIYFFGLVYSFLGVSIVADIFMCAIEKITSKTKRIHIASTKDDTPEIIEVNVWNGTVANLTLMALGSSAPEILLSMIEIVGNNFEAGDLGPGTIVGSAAFNLMAICAVCVIAIPNGETRRIDQIVVFAVTAFFSVFAYIWLLVILEWNSAGVVELYEAAITFALFPIMVFIAYAADKQWLNILFCQPRAVSSDTQRQIELGTFQPGESTYRVPVYFDPRWSNPSFGLVLIVTPCLTTGLLERH